MYDLEQLDPENTYFHFTPTSNLESIGEMGLTPRIGANARGAEKTFKVFFSQGNKGILELTEAWIKWTIYRLYVYDVAKSLGSQRQMNQEFDIARKAVITGTIPNYEQYKEMAIQKLIDEYSNCTYLAMDIKEGVDFRSDDVDEIKSKEKNGEFMSKMYGKEIPSDDVSMEKWNMHTLSNRTIKPEQLSIVSSEGKIDALSVIKKAYELSKTEDMKLPFLDELISRISENRSL